MSQETSNSQGSKAGSSNNRQGGNNKNRNRNRNRNQNRNRSNSGGQNRQGGNRKQGGGNRQRQAKPVPLTLWEKILKFFGLYKAPTRPPRRQSSTGHPAEAAQAKKTPKTKRAKSPKSAPAKGKSPRDSAKSFPVETPRLYLGNLSYDATEHDLEDLFKGIGSVRKVEIIYNRHTHRSKGYGFLEMMNVDEAKRAVEILHDQPFMGRNLVVNGANAKPKAAEGSRGDNRVKKNDAPKSEETPEKAAE